MCFGLSQFGVYFLAVLTGRLVWVCGSFSFIFCCHCVCFEDFVVGFFVCLALLLLMVLVV